MQERFADVINPKPKDTRTGAEIVADVVKMSGIKIINTHIGDNPIING